MFIIRVATPLPIPHILDPAVKWERQLFLHLIVTGKVYIAATHLVFQGQVPGTWAMHQVRASLGLKQQLQHVCM